MEEKGFDRNIFPSGYLIRIKPNGKNGSRIPIFDNCSIGEYANCSIRIRSSNENNFFCVIKAISGTQVIIHNYSNKESPVLVDNEKIDDNYVKLKHGTLINMLGITFRWEYFNEHHENQLFRKCWFKREDQLLLKSEYRPRRFSFGGFMNTPSSNLSSNDSFLPKILDALDLIRYEKMSSINQFNNYSKQELDLKITETVQSKFSPTADLFDSLNRIENTEEPVNDSEIISNVINKIPSVRVLDKVKNVFSNEINVNDKQLNIETEQKYVQTNCQQNFTENSENVDTNQKEEILSELIHSCDSISATKVVTKDVSSNENALKSSGHEINMYFKNLKDKQLNIETEQEFVQTNCQINFVEKNVEINQIEEILSEQIHSCDSVNATKVLTKDISSNEISPKSLDHEINTSYKKSEHEKEDSKKTCGKILGKKMSLPLVKSLNGNNEINKSNSIISDNMFNSSGNIEDGYKSPETNKNIDFEISEKVITPLQNEADGKQKLSVKCIRKKNISSEKKLNSTSAVKRRSKRIKKAIFETPEVAKSINSKIKKIICTDELNQSSVSYVQDNMLKNTVTSVNNEDSFSAETIKVNEIKENEHISEFNEDFLKNENDTLCESSLKTVEYRTNNIDQANEEILITESSETSFVNSSNVNKNVLLAKENATAPINTQTILSSEMEFLTTQNLKQSLSGTEISNIDKISNEEDADSKIFKQSKNENLLKETIHMSVNENICVEESIIPAVISPNLLELDSECNTDRSLENKNDSCKKNKNVSSISSSCLEKDNVNSFRQFGESQEMNVEKSLNNEQLNVDEFVSQEEKENEFIQMDMESHVTNTNLKIVTPPNINKSDKNISSRSLRKRAYSTEKNRWRKDCVLCDLQISPYRNNFIQLRDGSIFNKHLCQKDIQSSTPLSKVARNINIEIDKISIDEMENEDRSLQEVISSSVSEILYSTKNYVEGTIANSLLNNELCLGDKQVTVEIENKSSSVTLQTNQCSSNIEEIQLSCETKNDEITKETSKISNSSECDTLLNRYENTEQNNMSKINEDKHEIDELNITPPQTEMDSIQKISTESKRNANIEKKMNLVSSVKNMSEVNEDKHKTDETNIILPQTEIGNEHRISTRKKNINTEKKINVVSKVNEDKHKADELNVTPPQLETDNKHRASTRTLRRRNISTDKKINAVSSVKRKSKITEGSVSKRSRVSKNIIATIEASSCANELNISCKSDTRNSILQNANLNKSTQEFLQSDAFEANETKRSDHIILSSNPGFDDDKNDVNPVNIGTSTAKSCEISTTDLLSMAENESSDEAYTETPKSNQTLQESNQSSITENFKTSLCKIKISRIETEEINYEKDENIVSNENDHQNAHVERNEMLFVGDVNVHMVTPPNSPKTDNLNVSVKSFRKNSSRKTMDISSVSKQHSEKKTKRSLKRSKDVIENSDIVDKSKSEKRSFFNDILPTVTTPRNIKRSTRFNQNATFNLSNENKPNTSETMVAKNDSESYFQEKMLLVNSVSPKNKEKEFQNCSIVLTSLEFTDKSAADNSKEIHKKSLDTCITDNDEVRVTPKISKRKRKMSVKSNEHLDYNDDDDPNTSIKEQSSVLRKSRKRAKISKISKVKDKKSTPVITIEKRITRKTASANIKSEVSNENSKSTRKNKNKNIKISKDKAESSDDLKHSVEIKNKSIKIRKGESESNNNNDDLKNVEIKIKSRQTSKDKSESNLKNNVEIISKNVKRKKINSNIKSDNNSKFTVEIQTGAEQCLSRVTRRGTKLFVQESTSKNNKKSFKKLTSNQKQINSKKLDKDMNIKLKNNIISSCQSDTNSESACDVEDAKITKMLRNRKQNKNILAETIRSKNDSNDAKPSTNENLSNVKIRGVKSRLPKPAKEEIMDSVKSSNKEVINTRITRSGKNIDTKNVSNELSNMSEDNSLKNKKSHKKVDSKSSVSKTTVTDSKVESTSNKTDAEVPGINNKRKRKQNEASDNQINEKKKSPVSKTAASNLKNSITTKKLPKKTESSSVKITSRITRSQSLNDERTVNSPIAVFNFKSFNKEKSII